MDRRTFAKTGLSFGAISLAASYPQRVDAWFWFVARALVSFSGRTVGRQAARALSRSVSRPVTNRSNDYVRSVRPVYSRKVRDDRYPYAEYVGRELGKYGAESTFDYLYYLNNSQYGGSSQVLVVEEGRPDTVGVGFSTGEGARRIADFHGSHVGALDVCSLHLANSGMKSSEITGILYPVSGTRSNFNSNGYARVGRVAFDTPFGFVRMNSYYAGSTRVRADVFAQDEVSGRYFKWGDVPA